MPLTFKMIPSNKNSLNKIEILDRILLAYSQPLTIKQVSIKTGIPANTSRHIIGKYVQNGILTCLNPLARISRLYWLTDTGILRKKELCGKLNITYIEPDLPDIDWQLYGWICFSHRSMVIKALTCPMQPSQIKKVLRRQKPNIRISVNNIYDVTRLLLSKGIVKPIKVKKKTYLRYELTELGTKLRQLLMRADAVF